MLESGTRLHASTKKYTPEFNDENEEEIYMALVKSTEMIERKGMNLKIEKEFWFNNNKYNSEINAIIGFTSFYGNQIEPYHNHDFYEINYVKEGTLVQYIDHRKFVMKKGDLLLMSPEVKHVCYPVKGSKAYNILISAEYIKEIEQDMSRYNHANYLSYFLKHPAFLMFKNTDAFGISNIVNSFLQANSQIKSISQYYNLLSDSFVKQILILLSKCERMDHIYSSGKVLDDISERSDRIIQYIKENYDTVSIEKVCDVFGYTPQHIRRIVLKKTGNNFRMLIQRERMTRAGKLVSSTNIPIKEICETVGIDSPEYFSRWFKYQFGKSPTIYRQEARQLKNSENN